MCGIFGVISKNQTNENQLTNLTNVLSHRGPDAYGVSTIKLLDYYVGLGHRRLSIIDLDPRSNQPFKSNNLDIEIVFNGEIYNFLEIKKLCLNYKFSTNSDTEVIIASYIEFGVNSFNLFNGIFAFTLVDKKNNKVFFVRDRHGVKPLYYYLDPLKENIVFSSELKPITLFPGFSKNIDKESLFLMLSLKYIPSPRSIFSNVYKVQPGHYIEISNYSIFEEKKYFEVIDNIKLMKKNKILPTEQEIFQEIDNSVKRNLISDRGVSTFLSGGIDSTLVTAIAKKYVSELTSFTIGFEDNEFDESIFAEKIAKHLKIKNKKHIITYSEMVKIALNLANIYDEPFADSSQIPTYLVHKLVKDSGSTVVLAGDGGDEHFYGYNIFDKAKKRMTLFRIGNLLFRFFKFLVPFLIKSKYFKIFLPLVSIEYYYLYLYSGSDLSKSANLLSSKIDFAKTISTFSFLNKIKHEDPIVIEAIFSQKVYMVDDCLVKVDRASMNNGIETRVPLLDHTLTSLANSFNPNLHFNNGKKKILLKKLLSTYVPDNLIERPKKGFSIPLNKLLKENQIHDFILDIDEKFLEKQNLFNFKYISTLINEFYNKGINSHSNFIWNYFIFQQWYKANFN
jgi:asparagine synthase (glutamine-hydrolysing)